MNKIVIKKLTKSFSNDKPLYKNVNLEFNSGRVYAIVGNSGCGKTSLLNILFGNDNDYLGTILVNGTDLKNIVNVGLTEYHQYFVSYIHQTSTLFEKLSILDNLKLPNIEEEIKEDVDLLNIKLPLSKKVSKLSGGEKKKINIIQNINKECKLLLVDEPTANLDIINSKLVMEKLKDISKDKILIFVTHNLEIANKYADEIITIENNKIQSNLVAKKKCTETFELSYPRKLKNKSAFKAAKKFINSEAKENNIVLATTSVVLICLGLILSLLIGFKKYFNSQLTNSKDQTSMLVNQDVVLSTLDNNDYLELKEKFIDVDIKHKYLSEESVLINIDGVEIDADNSIINMPNLIDSHLKEDEIILTVSNEEAKVICEELMIDSFDDYLFLNNPYIEFEYLNITFSFILKDILIEDVLYPKITANSKSFYDAFHLPEEPVIYYVNKNEITDDFKTFLDTSKNIIIEEEAEHLYLYKTNQSLVLYNDLSTSYNLIPLNNKLITHNQNSLKFNTSLFYDGLKINSEIYFSPYLTESLLIGRPIESEDEIIISNKLFNMMNLSGLNKNISLTINQVTANYKIVGVINDNKTNYIYQNASWIYNQLTNTFKEPKYNMKTKSFLIVDEPSRIIEIEKEINQKYKTVSTSSYVGNTLNEINGIFKSIRIVSIVIVSLLTLISSISIIVLHQIEKDSYKKHIKMFADFGYLLSDINLIYIHILIRRAILCILYSILITYFGIFTTNKLLMLDEMFNTPILSYSIIIPIFITLLTGIIFIISYLFIRYKKASVS